MLTAAGLAAAVAATTTLLNIAWAFAGSATDSYKSRNVDIVVVRAGVAERITSSLNATLASRLADLPEVAGVDGSLTEMVSFGQQTLVGIPLHGLDPAGFAVGRLNVVSGRRLAKNDRHTVLLGSGLARALKKRPGESVEIEEIALPHRRRVSDRQRARVEHGGRPLGRRAGVDGSSGAGLRVSTSRACRRLTTDRPFRHSAGKIESLRDEKGRSLGFKAMPTRQFVKSDMETRLTTGHGLGNDGHHGHSVAGRHAQYDVDVGAGADARIGHFAGDRLDAGPRRCGSSWANRW